MNLDDLRGVQANERSTDSLQSLPDSFYRDVADYIEGLREERGRAAERADDPFGSEEVRRLTDEIDTAEEVAEAIYDRRIGKVVKRASLAAAGMPADEEGLTDEEARLFSDLVEQIESHRESVLAAFAGEESIESAGSGGGADASSGESASPAEDRVDPEPEPASGPDTDPAPATDTAPDSGAGEPALDAGAAMGGGEGQAARTDDDLAPTEDGPRSDGVSPSTEESSRDERDGVNRSRPDGRDAGGADEGAIGRTTVRITQDVGEILGVDEHVYTLAEEDVVTLPRANAEPLIDRDAASRIE